MTTGASARCVRVAGVEELLGYKCFGGGMEGRMGRTLFMRKRGGLV